MDTMRAAKRTLAMLCAAAIASFALYGSALAAEVHGADFHGTGSALESGEIDVLEVDGEAGETVFLTVESGGETIARNLPYAIGEATAQGDGSSWAGIATLDIANLNLDALDGAYTVSAYADRAGSELLYSGAIYGVYADLPDGTQKLIGTRTASAEEAAARAFEPADTLYVGGRTYRLAGEAEGETTLHFAYEEYDEATTVDGVIKYTDATGAVVATDKIPGLAYGEERAVAIPSVVEGEDGALYRTVFFRDSVTAVNPGQTSFSIYCTQMSDADQARSGFYVATIQMVDENGAVIATDSVNVTGVFRYTAPTTIYKTEVVDAALGEQAVIAYNLVGSPTIVLDAASDGVTGRVRTVQVNYESEPPDPPELDVTFNLLDGTKRVSEADRALGTATVHVDSDNPTALPEQQIEVDGAVYYLTGDPSDYAYVLRSGKTPVVNVYYTPEGYEPEGAYDVVVNYENFLTGEVVESHSYVSDPDANSRVTIATPATFEAAGQSYIRLDGQEDDIEHSYYSGIREYTVYYRDVNDTLTSGTVINTIRVVYADGGTAGGDGTATAGDGAAAGDADADAAQLQLNAGRTYNVLDGADNNATLTNEGGVDSNTERIEDNETPLSSGIAQNSGSTAATSFLSSASMVLPVCIGILAALVLVVAILAIRRRWLDKNAQA